MRDIFVLLFFSFLEKYANMAVIELFRNAILLVRHMFYCILNAGVFCKRDC